jgi:hypothetical protein
MTVNVTVVDDVTQLGKSRVNWLDVSSPGTPALLDTDAYGTDDIPSRVTVVLQETQKIRVGYCGQAPGTPCNVENKTPLLLAKNLTSAPIRLRLSRGGVSAVGAQIVAPGVPSGTVYAPQIWVRTAAGDLFPFQGIKGVAGGLANAKTDPAPFVGASVTGGDRIVEVCFDAVHASTVQFGWLGIGFLYLRP